MRALFLILILLSCDFQGSSRRSSRGLSSSNGVRALSNFELRHFVDPETGNISEKLSIPRNYSGNIYLAVDNLQKLVTKHLYVRFTFGHDQSVSPIVLPTTISSAPSVSPGESQPVLVINLGQRPFLGMPLSYDLYDYNTYNFTSNVASVEMNNRDKDLYCRGLKLKDDPTSNGKDCNGSSSTCLYAYAKLTDRSWRGTSPLYPQIARDGGSYMEDSEASYLSKCLSDGSTQSYITINGNQDVVNQFIQYGDTLELGLGSFQYLGPYRPVNEALWEIEGNALWGNKGLFLASLIPSRKASTGYRSLLFPRYAKLGIKSNVEHVGADKPTESEDIQTSLDSDGKSYWMSGCNLRVTTKDPSGHHIGSCNISATIDVFYYEGGDEVFVASSQWEGDSKRVKLQILQDGDLKDNGVLNPDYKTCSSDSACADNECCFNGRCWSDELITQCTPSGGGSMRPKGETCSSDFDCFSLCCGEDNICADHNPASGSYCGKDNEKSCVASQWCATTNIERTKIIRRGALPDDCRKMKCTIPVHNDCINNVCKARESDFQDDYPDWVEGDCSEAIEQPAEWTCI